MVDDIMTAAFGGLLGAGLGAAAMTMLEQQRQKRDLAIDMFGEFNSPRTLELRVDAESVLETHAQRYGAGDPDSEIALWHLESNVSSSDYMKVISLLGLFEKIVVLYEQQQADRRILRALLGPQARFWYGKYVRRLTATRPELEELLKTAKRLKHVTGTKEKLKEYP